MSNKKYFAIEQTGGVPTNVQQISADRYSEAIRVVVEPEKPSKKIGITGRFVGYQLYGKLSNYGATVKFNWAVYKGDAFVTSPVFIEGSNEGDLIVSDGEFFVNLFEKRELLQDGVDYRLYVADHNNVDETRGFVDVKYSAPEEDNKGNTGKPDPVKPTDPITPTVSIQPGEIKALKVDFAKGWSQIPIYSLPTDAMNIPPGDMPWEYQAKYAKAGVYNYIHIEALLKYMGGIKEDYNPRGVTWEDVKKKLAEYDLPTSVGLYRIAYSNAVAHFFPAKIRQGDQEVDNRAIPDQRQMNETIEGFGVGILKAIGWDKHPIIIDLDFEERAFFFWGATNAVAQAIKYTFDRNPSIKINFMVFASGWNASSDDEGGNAQNPHLQTNGGERYRLFRQANVNLYSGSVPYFKTPAQEWNDPNHAPSVIGEGKLYKDEADYGAKSLNPIRAKIGWTDGYKSNKDLDKFPMLEWYMAQYEGGDDGKQRFYDPFGNWINSLNWIEMPEWIQEGLTVLAGVMGTFDNGGGSHLWVDGRAVKVSNFAFELGKARLYAYNDFHENSATLWNQVLEFSLDGGKTWNKDTDSRGSTILQTNTDPKPYARGAFLNGKLWIVATAGQPYHLNGQSQSVILRYRGKQIPFTLASQTVHSFTVEI
ncbi:hypothetical protein [Siphonobacter sp. SORGH_AS_1065]|uniref:hypothetical protein n=1 Tax=Siphonobacter sp. SORGH_AS_1065 TaxID=3041795 RepID=UPI002786C38E|nr:hypothetical protein [Siphonobacter sp. SORGH_AS_1065]MDQ1088571.1 hypothetical protein [Siphonobacter sp. SORGH_AS_1065]